MAMPSEKDKMSYIIYPDIESLIKKIKQMNVQTIQRILQ